MFIKKISDYLEQKLMIIKIEKFIDYIGKFNMINKKGERILISLLVCSIVLLIISQVGLVNETTRTFFTDIDMYEGVSVENIDEIFKEGEVILELIDIEPSDKIRILVNGSEIKTFKAKTENINVRNNCVIEIDGTDINMPFKVKIAGVSDNISNEHINKDAVISSNIAVLTRIFIK